MLLDNRTLLFSIVLVSAMMSFALAVVSKGQEHDGLKKWSVALALEAIAFALSALRGEIADVLSILLFGILMIGAQALKLAAIHEFRGIAWPRLQCLLPIALAALALLWLPYSDLRDRIIIGSLIYGAQMLMLVQALRGDVESSTGRAWWLLFGSTLTMLPLFALRALVAYFDVFAFAAPQNTIAPNPVQLAVFASLIALSLLGSMGFILMVKERADRALRAMAMNDSLTGIFNRRAFMERAEQEYAIARRNKTPLSLLMLDIDHFKHINDEYGHSTGDDVLVDIVRVLAQRLRKQDTLGRYGGEEFCITLPSTDAAGAMNLAETLRSAVEKTPLVGQRKEIFVTISIGVIACHASCATCSVPLKNLFENADAALYQAKRGGRNRAVMLSVGCAEKAAEEEVQ
jgi:diguanylate cyclase (GGDEF)-like protein